MNPEERAYHSPPWATWTPPTVNGVPCYPGDSVTLTADSSFLASEVRDQLLGRLRHESHRFYPQEKPMPAIHSVTALRVNAQTVDTSPCGAPAGLIATAANPTVGGYVGQVFIEGTVVWQSEVVSQVDADNADTSASAAALKLANARVVAVLTGLFSAA